MSVLLFMLIFGIIGYAYMMSFRQAISQGAAEGARAGAVAPASLTDAETITRARNALNEALDSYDIQCVNTSLRKDGATVVGSCGVTLAACAGNTTSQCVSVAVDYWYRDHSLIPSLPLIGMSLPQHLRYTATAEVNA